jgi:hypothetical protein
MSRAFIVDALLDEIEERGLIAPVGELAVREGHVVLRGHFHGHRHLLQALLPEHHALGEGTACRVAAAREWTRGFLQRAAVLLRTLAIVPPLKSVRFVLPGFSYLCGERDRFLGVEPRGAVAVRHGRRRRRRLCGLRCALGHRRASCVSCSDSVETADPTVARLTGLVRSRGGDIDRGGLRRRRGEGWRHRG